MTTVIDPAVGLIQPTGAPLPIAQGGSGGNTGFFSGIVQSMIWVNTANGYGSTNTAINRYSTVVVSQGTDITYTDSATLGASFTINTSGVYSIKIDSQPVNAGSVFGISLNSNQLTTNLSTIAIANRLATSQSYAASAISCAGATVYLASGSIIRSHGDGTAIGTSGISALIITRVA